MEEKLSDENDILKLIMQDVKIGWWRKNKKTGTLSFSDFTKELAHVDFNSLSFDDFILYVREDYRDRILKEIENNVYNNIFDQVFPINTPKGLIWVHAKSIKKECDDEGNVITTGFIQTIEDVERVSPQKASSLRINNLLYQLNKISQILLLMLKADESDNVINTILKDILKQFKAGRTYIIEYNWEKQTQTCTYEVADSNVTAEIDLLHDLPLRMNTWWTDEIIAGHPIILSTLDDLPEEAGAEKDFLAYQDIKSLFVVPLISKEGVWGYAGVDVVETPHKWTKEDCEWLTALINIISLCIQLQRSEKEALQDKKYLQNLYKNMPLGYLRLNMVYDIRGKIIDYIYTDSNPAVENLFQQPFSSYIGKKGSKKALDFNKKLEFVTKGIHSNNNFETEYYIPKSNKFTTVTMYSIQKDEIICLFSDITESYNTAQKLIDAKEKAEISDKLKSAFLANMSHEIRTPLNAIIGFSDLLIEAEDKNERQTYYNIVRKNNDLLLQLISDILDISKIEAGTLNISPSVVDVNKLFEEIIHYHSIRTKIHPVKVFLDQHIPSCVIYGDKNRLSQIINNFINNALKFTERGFIAVGYYLEKEDKIKFYVKDTGCGIPEESQESIFMRFVKLDTFTSGTGLGLPICKSLVEQMGGEIGVESEVGKGSCFWFTHPYQIVEEKECKIKKENKQELSYDKKDFLQKILIAEDTDSNYILLKSILKNKYTLIRALNGIDAIELFRQHSPDLILMDIRMPKMDGLEATEKIRELNKNIPIMAVTAFAFDSDKEKALQAGCNDYLSKPIKPKELLEKIEEYIGK